MLCARLVRGSTSASSNHSWGTAIDLTLDGVLDQRGDGRVQVGLTRIAPIFNRHSWFWGAGFRTEDGMHFEASDELLSLSPVVRLDQARHHVATASLLGVRGREHRIGLADTRRRAKEDLQPPSPLLVGPGEKRVG